MLPLLLAAATRPWPLIWALLVAALVLAVVGLVVLRRPLSRRGPGGGPRR